MVLFHNLNIPFINTYVYQLLIDKRILKLMNDFRKFRNIIESSPE